MSTILFDPIKTMSKITDSVLCGFSTGKESVVVLDLCFKYFKHVQPYYLYSVPNLEFQEKSIRWYEKKYNTQIIRLPSETASEFFHYGSFRIPDPTFPLVSETDIWNYLRQETGIWWVANGERIDDSIMRRAMIKSHGTIYEKGGRFYPVATWKKQEIKDYIKFHKLYMGQDSKIMGHSARVLHSEDLLVIKQNFPEDYQKILRLYPFAEAGVKRLEEYGKK